MTTPAQRRQVQCLGFDPNSPNVSNTVSLNAAASGGYSQTWLAYGFVPEHNATLNKVRVDCFQIHGSPGAADVRLDIFSDNGGVPNASLASTTTITGAIAAGIVEFTGLSLAVTAGQQYYIVLRNANSSPTTNYPAFRFGSAGSAISASTGNGGYGWFKQHSTTGGGSWTSVVSNSAGWRVDYSDGTFDGLMASSIAISSDLVYATRASGVQFTSPAGGALQVAGLAFYVAPKTGTPSQGALFRLYTGGTPMLLASTYVIPAASIPSSGTPGWFNAYFLDGGGNPLTVTLQPSTVVTATLEEASNGDTSSNAYRLYEIDVDTDSNSVGLLPFEGTLEKVYYDGSSWTTTSGAMFASGLLLDTNREFGSSAGGTSRGVIIGG